MIYNSWPLLCFDPKHTCCEPTLIHFALSYLTEFDNEYHEWLIDKLEADNASNFMPGTTPRNMKPFDKEFPNWFQVSQVPDNPNLKLDHLARLITHTSGWPFRRTGTKIKITRSF